jgi:hypothetical protein
LRSCSPKVGKEEEEGEGEEEEEGVGEEERNGSRRRR